MVSCEVLRKLFLVGSFNHFAGR
ncbi:hypothetical protein NC652_002266 [Populus alba x Populus x berolinensis]|uniref:Uncharacterized protein n=1 Tax=Populus alba x Populus x berolinensis TaxID=444605 RepID=A0AAD6WH80_9ROSI|nr:hypothetical protein NC652_002266 [Populus alba x Populus x berolinensis]KAJ7012232.1 hypothetical protein NC653_002333 [Populus alba x Populus x berolinensis]